MSNDVSSSPHIVQISWGNMKVAGVGKGKDFKLWPGGGREWDWRETGTRHEPGILPADLEELLDHGCQAIVLSRGMLRRLATSPEAMALLESRHIAVHVAETKAAVEIYNRLVDEGMAVGGLFHSTC
jgi:hypothetical protein